MKGGFNLKEKQLLSLVGAGVVTTALITSYGIAFAMKLPLPLINDGIFRPDYIEQQRLIDRWNNVRMYTPSNMDTQEATVAETSTKEKAMSEQEFLDRYAEIESQSFIQYVNNNTDIISSGYDKLIIDKVDKTNIETGIKTINGDDVIGIDASNNIMMVGTSIDGVQAKIAILKNKSQIGLSVVDSMMYWDEIAEHANKENAILAINASDYSWNTTGDYGTLYGLAIRNGDMIRRAQNTDNVVGFDKDGNIQLGGDSSTIYNGCEGTSKLITNGEVYVSNDDNTKTSRAAIGQSDNGDIYIVITDNGVSLGALAEKMKQYNISNGASLSSGKCATMWWNGKIVNNIEFPDEAGIKLPTAWVVRKSN